MTKLIKGYQYGDEKQYIGEYEFEDNLDKEDVHIPPRTTLIPPPAVPEGMRAVWNGTSWGLEESPEAKFMREAQALANQLAAQEAEVQAQIAAEIEAQRLAREARLAAQSTSETQ